MRFYMKKALQTILIAGLIIVTAQLSRAQETESSETASLQERDLAEILPYEYAPEGCEFEMRLPSEPATARRCHPMMPNECALMDSFTRVFDLAATVNIFFSCKPIGGATRSNYTEDALRIMLVSRPGVTDLETQEIAIDERENFTRAALLGAGPSQNGQDVMIYTTQIWVGDKSVLTMEGELIGAAHEQADLLFADILHSLRFKDEAAGAENQEDSGDTNGDDEVITEEEKEEEKEEE